MWWGNLIPFLWKIFALWKESIKSKCKTILRSVRPISPCRTSRYIVAHFQSNTLIYQCCSRLSDYSQRKPLFSNLSTDWLLTISITFRHIGRFVLALSWYCWLQPFLCHLTAHEVRKRSSNFLFEKKRGLDFLPLKSVFNCKSVVAAFYLCSKPR